MEIKIEHYDDRYLDDIICLIRKFHVSFYQGFDRELNLEDVRESIFEYRGENSKNAFLLVADGKCVGILSGLEIISRGNKKRLFSENFWFIDEPYGKYVHWFLSRVEKMLKDYGFDIIVMAVLYSEKEARIKRMYEIRGYSHLETHYMKTL